MARVSLDPADQRPDSFRRALDHLEEVPATVEQESGDPELVVVLPAMVRSSASAGASKGWVAALAYVN
jgi:hypothetical protein